MLISSKTIWGNFKFLFLILITASTLQAGSNQYIVRLKSTCDVNSVSRRFRRITKGKIKNRYEYAIKGFTIKLPAKSAAEKIDIPAFLKTLDTNIISVEKDVKVYLHSQQLPTGVDRIDADLHPVARIDGINETVDVNIAVIDSGIDSDHPDLNVYAAGSESFVSEDANDWEDEDGHGTAVAGIIGALDNNTGTVGVAPGARLWALKAIEPGGSGYVSDVIDAIDYITQNADQIEVVNISLGTIGKISSYRDAIQSSVQQGIVYVVSAGNDSNDIYGEDGIFETSDDYIPAAYPEVMSVSAMVDTDGKPGGLGYSTSAGSDDSFANFSNYSQTVISANPVTSAGSGIDVIAPGVLVRTTEMGGGYRNFSGTSAAAPHISGLAALYIGLHGRAENAADVYTIRQNIINGGIEQTDSRGFQNFTDPDVNPEPIGYYIRGDFDYSGKLNYKDLAMLAESWLTADIQKDIFPLGGDGNVDFADLSVFSELWLK